jgi:capsular polysaccharide biosynthesis protein
MPALPLETAYGILKKQINVRQSRGTSLIEIEAFSDNKDEAAAIANEVAKAYRDRRQKIRNDIAASGITVLRSSLTNRWREIEEQQQRVSTLRTNLNIADYEAYANLPTPTLDQEQLRKLDSQVMEAEVRYAQIEIVYTNLLALQASGDHAALQRSMPHMWPDNTLNTLIDSENTAEQSLARMTNALGAESPDLKSLKDVLKTVRKQIDERLAGIVDGVKTRLDSDKGLAEKYRAIMKVAREKDKENFIERRPYYEAKDKLAQMKEVHMRLSYNVEAQEMELAMPRSAVVQIVEQAVPNDRPVLPRKNWNIAAGVVFGLIIGIGLAFFIEYLDTSVKTIDDVERALQAPVLGVIPQNVGVLIDEGPRVRTQRPTGCCAPTSCSAERIPNSTHSPSSAAAPAKANRPPSSIWPPCSLKTASAC